jgi:hypothetical protein
MHKGLYLSVIIRVGYSDPPDEIGLRLLHLSVQDGSLVHDVPLVIEPSRSANLSEVDMEWCESLAEWPEDAVSCLTRFTNEALLMSICPLRKDQPE